MYLLSALLFCCALSSSRSSPASSRLGIGCYNDTPWSPPISAQLPVAANLTGGAGWVLLFLESLDPAAAAPAPAPWEAAALRQAYALGLRVVARLGQRARNYRSFSDDPAHLSYLALASAWRAYAAQLPLPPDGSTPLHIQIANEPNVCMEWQCEGGQGVFISAAQVAAEAASFTRDVARALRSLPQLAVAAPPVAGAGFAHCECVWAGANGPQDVNGTVFLSAMLQQVPRLFEELDALIVHPYPACGQLPYSENCAGGWLASYKQQAARVAASRAPGAPPLPVIVGETGWPSANETGKAQWMVQALQQLFLADESVAAVLPFLLAGPFWEQQGWPWTLWDPATGNTSLRQLQPQFLAVQAL